MARVSTEAKQRFADRVKPYHQMIEAMIAQERTIRADVASNENGAAYKRLQLADAQLNLASVNLLLNRISLGVLGLKNEKYLNDARTCCYAAVIDVESVVGSSIDAPFSENNDRLAAIEAFPEQDRFRLIRKMGFAIESVQEDLGENNRWKWSFVELEGRLAAVTKNVSDFRQLVAGLDPRVPGYEERVEHLHLIKKLLRKSADRFREKYELVTNRLDDFRDAILFLQALKRVHTLIGETQQADDIKKQSDVWMKRMEDEQKKAELKGK